MFGSVLLSVVLAAAACLERFLQRGSATCSKNTRQEVSLRMSETLTNVHKSTGCCMDNRLLLHKLKVADIFLLHI